MQLCAPSNTRIHDYGGQGAAGTEFNELVVTNISSSPCRTGGYPGFTLIGTDGSALPDGAPRPAARRRRGAGRACLLSGRARPRLLRITLPDNHDFAYVPLTEGGSINACQGKLDAFRVFNRKPGQERRSSSTRRGR
jgi:hypothetical protein